VLAITRHGEAGDAPPLVIAHGLFGSARNWAGIARTLATGREVLAVDMRNHGESAWSDTHGYPEMADDLAGVIAAQGGRADVLGHSMGGKAAMALALARPELVARLIVADIAPVAYDHDQSGYIHAMRAVDLAAVSRRSDADRQLAASVPEPGIRAFLLQSLDVAGRRWRLNLDTLEREMPKVVGFPALETAFDGPALFIAGDASEYVRPEHRDTIRAHFPAARVVRLRDAGHWLHADRPQAFTETLSAFLHGRG